MDPARDPLDVPGEGPDDPKIPEKAPALLPGTLLLASDILEDPNFRDTIVLVCRHDRDGAYGLVLNRPSHMPLREIFEISPGEPGGSERRRVYIGGPVRPEELQVLHLGDDPVPEAVAVARGVNVAGRWDSLEAILSRPAASLRLFLGYAGWGPGQLEDEIVEGAWDLCSAPDLRRLLETPEETWARDGETLREFLGKWTVDKGRGTAGDEGRG